MASRVPITGAPTRAPANQTQRFLAALTATNQLTTAEKRAARSTERRTIRKARYVAWMTMEARYQQARAASGLACCARVAELPDIAQRKVEADRCFRALVDAVANLMSLPLVNQGDLADRRRMLSKGHYACNGPAHDSVWKVYCATWTAQLKELEAR